MSIKGTQQDADSPSFLLDPTKYTDDGGVTNPLLRYSLMSFTTANDGFIESHIGNQEGSRENVVGSLVKRYPPILNVSDPYGNNKLLSPVVKEVSVNKRKASWFLVIIPASGSSVTIDVGDDLVPSNITNADGAVMPKAASTTTDTFDETIAKFEEAENRKIIGKAWSRIHDYDLDSSDTTGIYDRVNTLFLGGGPSLGIQELPAGTAFSSITNGVRVGYVFGELY